MRLSVERLRWGLLAGAVLLVGVVVVLLSYGRYRAVRGVEADCEAVGRDDYA